MAEVINLIDETFLGSFMLTGYMDEATGTVTLAACLTREDGDNKRARAYLYPEDVKQLIDAFESGDSETSQKIFMAVVTDMARQFGFKIS